MQVLNGLNVALINFVDHLQGAVLEIC